MSAPTSLLVVGGSRGTGRAVAEAARRDGLAVTVLSRTPPDGLDVAHVAGDATEAGVVKGALGDHDAVVIAVGAGLGDRTTRTEATRRVVEALAGGPARRLVAVSSLGVGDSRARMGLAGRAITRTLLRNAIHDHSGQEALLQGLDATVVRAAGLADGRTGHRVVGADGSLPGGRVGRDDVAEVVLAAVRGETTGTVHVVKA